MFFLLMHFFEAWGTHGFHGFHGEPMGCIFGDYERAEHQTCNLGKPGRARFHEMLNLNAPFPAPGVGGKEVCGSGDP